MSSKRQEREVEDACSICMQRKRNAQINGCSHSFCIRCVRKWSKKHNSCPLCREKYTKILYRRQEIEVQDHTRERRPPRVQPPSPVIQRRIVFLPFTPFFNYQQQPLVPLHSASQAMLMFGPVMSTSLPLCPPPQIFSGLAYS